MTKNRDLKTKASFGITFDDVLLLPGYTDFERNEIDVSSKLSRNIFLKVPLVSSPMDTVTESVLAVELARNGGIGIIHRNLTVKDQSDEVKKVKSLGYCVGAAIGSGRGYEERMEGLAKSKVDAVVIDSAHGYTEKTIKMVKDIKKKYPKIDVIAGNIATYEAAMALICAGADGLRVGMGPGAICTTRVISGMGVPQISAISEVRRAAGKNKVPIIADGGIKYSGDIVKALAAGADSVMMGNYFASSVEPPGETVVFSKEQVPHRFRSILNDKRNEYLFKEYRGMGSVKSMTRGAKIKSESEFHGKNYKDKVMVAEGVEGLVPIRGSLKQLVDQAVGGIKSGMYYVGVKNISSLQKKARFIQVSQASLTESHPHDLFITNGGENYL